LYFGNDDETSLTVSDTRPVAISIWTYDHSGNVSTTHEVVVDWHDSPLCRWSLIDARPSGCWPGRQHSARERTWAIESANGMGKLLAQQLLGAGEHIVDVPPTLSARLLGSTKAAKNDHNEALSTAIAGLRHCELRTVRVEDPPP
jgi:hypothetical protein